MDTNKRLARIRSALEIIEDDPTPAQLAKIMWDILNILEEKQGLGFQKDKK